MERTSRHPTDRFTARLFLEELVCELCRFLHTAEDPARADGIRIAREISLGDAGTFADIRVEAPGQRPYLVEVKVGYPTETIAGSLARKYGASAETHFDAAKLVLVVDGKQRASAPDLEARLRRAVRPGLEVELWDEQHLVGMVRKVFGIQVESVTDNHLALRASIDRVKWQHAFAGEHTDHPLASPLMWHFGYWRLRELHEGHRWEPHAILAPRHHKAVAVLIADLASFSSYVRDTPDGEVVRNSLTAFYSRARSAIQNAGGMLYQFVGDEVVGLFGIPDRRDRYLEEAIECARALVDIGNSVSNNWQRQIDRVQKSAGVHIGLAIGDLDLVSLRPYDHSQVGVVGDSINLAARLLSAAGASEIIVSNSLHTKLTSEVQALFERHDPVDAKNIGMVKCWKQRAA